MSNSILVIDDEQDIRVLIKYNLEKEGFVVSQAEDGENGASDDENWGDVRCEEGILCS